MALKDGDDLFEGLEGPERPEAPAAPEAPARPAAGYLERSRDRFNSLILATPLFVLYQVGVLTTNGWKNGVDFATRELFQVVGRSTALYVLLNLGILGGLLLAARFIGPERRLTGGTWALVLLESAVYASLLGGVVTRILELLGMHPIGLSRSALDNVVLSFGAGAYEELVFRLLILSGVAWLAQRLGVKRLGALVLAFAISSLLFSAAHYHPFGSEDWEVWSFAYRAVAGVLFGILFVTRGFAVAAYTHALYDIHVLLLH